MDEAAALQRQREEEADARRAARKTGAPLPEPTERTAPRLNLARPSGGGWRERQAAKEVGGGASEPAPTRELPVREPAREEPRRAGYVPPHLRAGASSGGSAPPRDAPPREGPSGDRWSRQPREAPSPQPEESKPASSGGKWVPKWKQQQS